MFIRGAAIVLGPGPFAHPVAGHPHVDVPVALVAAGTGLLVAALGLLVPVRRKDAGSWSADGPPVTSWEGTLNRSEVVTRVLAVGVLVLAVVAGRLGTRNELDNLAPALMVGVGWPLLFLASLLPGRVWRRVDPWDAAARAVLRDDPSTPAARAWPAVPVAVAVTWFLATYPRPLDPRSVGTALVVYTVVVLAGCVAVGRRRCLSSFEPIGVALSVAAQARPGGARWRVPVGAGAVLGALAAGTMFGALRRTELGADLVGSAGVVELTLVHVVACVVGAALVVVLTRVAQVLQRPVQRTGDEDAGTGVAVAAAVAVVGVVVAVALARNRLFTSAQLLPGLLGDPLGLGWDLLGGSTDRLGEPALGAAGLLTTQLVVVALTHLWGAWVVGRRLHRTPRLPAVLLLLQSAAASVAVVALH